MKIIHVIDQLEIGGAERVCVNLVNLFFRNGYDIKLIVFDKKGSLFNLLDAGIDIVFLDKSKSKIKAYRKAVKELEDADIVHVHMRKNYRFVKKAHLLFGSNKNIVLHDHYGKVTIDKRVRPFFKAFKPKFYIGCSKILSDWAIEYAKIKKENVYLVSNFVLKQESNNVVKQKEGLVLVGNLKEVKNHKFAIDLAKKINKNLTIYCSSTSNDYFKTLEDYLVKINYSNNVNFITDCNNVQLELKNYELALLTSKYEGDPLVLVEYLAQSIPFLSSNVGESVKVIKNYFPAFVQNDFELENWVKNYHLVKNTLGKDIDQVYEQHFSSKVYLDKYLKIYNNILQL